MGIDLKKNQDLRLFEAGDLPESVSPGQGRSRGGRFFSLRNLMLSLVYFALVFWVLQNVMTTDEVIQKVLLAVLIGLGVASIGLYAASQMIRYSFLGWLVFVIGYMILMAATISVFAFPSFPILLGSIFYLQQKQRTSNQDALLWVLQVASVRKMPLAPGVHAFSTQSSGIFAIWAEALAELLRQGQSLPEAIALLPRVASESSTMLIRMGHEAGDLAGGLKSATLARSQARLSNTAALSQFVYLGWVLFSGFSITGFILYFVMPKFEAIFMDFGVTLPEITKLVILTSHYLVDYFWIPFVISVVFLMYVTQSFVRSNEWKFPLIDRVLSRGHTILILRSIAVNVEADQPVGSALRVLAHWYPVGWVRKRLATASLYCDQGVPWTESMHGSGLLTRSDAGLLESATRVGNLAWAIHELIETSERRRATRLDFWSQVLFVISTMMIGTIIGVIAMSFFIPLISLIERLSS